MDREPSNTQGQLTNIKADVNTDIQASAHSDTDANVRSPTSVDANDQFNATNG